VNQKIVDLPKMSNLVIE